MLVKREKLLSCLQTRHFVCEDILSRQKTPYNPLMRILSLGCLDSNLLFHYSAGCVTTHMQVTLLKPMVPHMKNDEDVTARLTYAAANMIRFVNVCF